MRGGPERWIRRTTSACVALLAEIAGTVSYLHMHMLIALHGQPGWVAALTPLSVDGMIVVASMTLLAASRSGRKGGGLPWVLLVISSVASLAADVVVAEPTLVGRVIAAWPSFALTASYELLTRQVRADTIGEDWRGQKVRRGRREARDAGGCWSLSRAQHGLLAVVRRCSGRRGSGRWPGKRSTGGCRAARQSPTFTAGTSDGDGSPRTLGRSARSATPPRCLDTRSNISDAGSDCWRDVLSAFFQGSRSPERSRSR
jgi:Protein of unknown function (DUF2637)